MSYEQTGCSFDNQLYHQYWDREELESCNSSQGNLCVGFIDCFSNGMRSKHPFLKGVGSMRMKGCCQFLPNEVQGRTNDFTFLELVDSNLT